MIKAWLFLQPGTCRRTSRIRLSPESTVATFRLVRLSTRENGMDVRLMLLWTGRLGLMPEVVRWAEKRFPVRIEMGSGRMLYLEE
jgi:hypothetical protein